MSRLAVCSAGTSPKSSVVNIATSRLKASTGMFSRMTASRGIVPSGMSAAMAFVPPYANRQPSAAPPAASSTLSTSSWRMTRHRLAPRATRIAISRSRAVARVSSMLATLLHAMRSSNPTAAASVYSVVLNWPTMLSTQLMAFTLNCLG